MKNNYFRLGYSIEMSTIFTIKYLKHKFAHVLPDNGFRTRTTISHTKTLQHYEKVFEIIQQTSTENLGSIIVEFTVILLKYYIVKYFVLFSFYFILFVIL